MQTIKHLSDEYKVNADEYENLNTGSTLHDDLQGESMTIKKANGYFQIDSDDYITFDTAAIDYLMKELNRADAMRVFEIGKMVAGDCSIVCHKNRVPHSSETLSTTLEMSLNKFYAMVRRLVKKGVLAYCVCAPAGYVQKIYMLNPYIARKKRNLNCELLTFFKDVTKI